MLGGGGYVAGPMVYAAWRKRTPAALTEADAHLGLANRLAARVRAARLPRLRRCRTARGAKYRVVGRPIPAKARPLDRAVARAQLGLAGGRAGAADRRRACRRAGAERARGRGVRRGRAAGAARLRRARLRVAARRVSRADYRLVPVLDGLGAAYGACDLALTRSGGTVWELAAAGLPAILVPYPFATADHQTLNARYFERGGGAIRRAGDRARTRARARALAARTIADRLARMARAHARAREAGRGARHRRGADRACRRLTGRRIWFVGIGGAGLSAYATIAARVGRRGRRLGSRRHALPRRRCAGTRS